MTLAARSLLAAGGFVLAGCASQPAPCEATSPAAVAAPGTNAAQEVAVNRAPAPPASVPAPSPAPAPDVVTPAPGQTTTVPSDPMATVTTAPATPAGTPTGNCTLGINSIPASNVELDGRALGATPRVGVEVTSGVTHRVIFRSDTAGTAAVSVQCKPGEKRTVAVRIGPSPTPPSTGPADPFGSVF